MTLLIAQFGHAREIKADFIIVHNQTLQFCETQ